MTLRLPKELYERLRLEAFERHVSQASIIVETLTRRYEHDGASRRRPGWSYPPGYTDERADRLPRAAENLRVYEIDNPPAYLGTAIAVADMVIELDAALRDRAPFPERWTMPSTNEGDGNDTQGQ